MSDFHIQPIPAQMVPQMWRYAEPYIKRALDHTSGELRHEDVAKLCEAQDMQLWLVASGNRCVGAITTEIVVYPHRKHLRVVTLAGSQFSEWIELADNILVEFATQTQCHAVEALVRKGFVMKLAPLDYRHKYSVVVKEIAK